MSLGRHYPHRWCC